MNKLAATLILITVPTGAWAQTAPAPAEGGGEPISALMFFTFLAAIAIGVGALLWFLRRRSNREAADRALNPNHPANR